MMNVEFRSLTPADIPLLHEWLNMPHMRTFYQKTPISQEEVEQKYLPRTLPESRTRCHIVQIDGLPIGKMQCYLNNDYPDYASEIEVVDGVSIDLFIGHPARLGQKLCGPMLQGYLAIVGDLFPDQSEIYVCHDRRNTVAIACSRSAGFVYIRDVTESGSASVLLAIEQTLSSGEHS